MKFIVKWTTPVPAHKTIKDLGTYTLHLAAAYGYFYISDKAGALAIPHAAQTLVSYTAYFAAWFVFIGCTLNLLTVIVEATFKEQ